LAKLGDPFGFVRPQQKNGCKTSRDEASAKLDKFLARPAFVAAPSPGREADIGGSLGQCRLCGIRPIAAKLWHWRGHQRPAGGEAGQAHQARKDEVRRRLALGRPTIRDEEIRRRADEQAMPCSAERQRARDLGLCIDDEIEEPAAPGKTSSTSRSAIGLRLPEKTVPRAVAQLMRAFGQVARKVARNGSFKTPSPITSWFE
jgi:hypothetical protein